LHQERRFDNIGGRGSSIGVGVKGKAYGTEYYTIYQSGNIKFLKRNGNSTAVPMETMTKGRVYVTIGQKNEVRSISYYDKNNKRFKQIDVTGKEHTVNGKKILPHTHKGYEHKEKGTHETSLKEQKMIERVKKIWDYILSCK